MEQEYLDNYILSCPNKYEDTKFNPHKEFAVIGLYVIQDAIVYGLPGNMSDRESYRSQWTLPTGEIVEHPTRDDKSVLAPPKYNIWDIINLLISVPGVKYEVEHTGKRTGYGHGYETIRFLNENDDSLIYERYHVDYCEGPGYSCSYDHSGSSKYGEYLGSRDIDPKIKEFLNWIKENLGYFNFDCAPFHLLNDIK